MTYVIGLLCALGVVAATAVHVLTFTSGHVFSAPGSLWLLLHAGCIVATAALVISARATYGSDVGRLWQTLPGWGLAVLGIAALYMIVNFGLFAHRVREGQAQFRNGRYSIYDHGRLVRESSVDEYRRQQTYITRGFSGHWMLFYLAPTIYFLTRQRPAAKKA